MSNIDIDELDSKLENVAVYCGPNFFSKIVKRLIVIRNRKQSAKRKLKKRQQRCGSKKK